MHICTIDSTIHNKISSALIITKDEGFYELEVHVDEDEMKASGDPLGLVQKTIAEHLASCVAHTELPLKEGLWRVTFTHEAQKAFNFPGEFIA